MQNDDFVRPTTGFWQALLDAPDDASAAAFPAGPPYRYGYPAPLPDRRRLVLPIRKVAGTSDRAVASLIANQASFEVVRALAAHMADLARPMNCDVIAGLPTLGMVFAPLVAEQLAHARYVPLGYSLKFWYDEALSASVQSLTTPTQGKRVYLDPNQLPLIAGRRVVIVDDAVSTGGTLVAVIELLERLGAEIAGVVVAMRQGSAWRDRLGPDRAALVAGVFDSPRLTLRDDGWWPE
jgi:adenine/guanine phosphoribosyltransferase-like PRPP-binding protein